MVNSSNGPMNLAGLEIEQIEPRLRYKVGYEVGFACPDVDDLVQESLRRFVDACLSEKLRDPEAAGAFLNGICRNVILEYRRRLHRDGPMPVVEPDQPMKGLSHAGLFELREAIEAAMKQLAPRDAVVLRAFYIEERSVEQILEMTGLTLTNFRVVLCRAKEKFRRIYSSSVKSGGASGH